MAISTLADFASSGRQRIQIVKSNAPGSALTWRSSFTVANGYPTAGSGSAGNTANGIVPTDATAGYPTIFFGSGQGIITYIDQVVNTTAGVITLFFDRLFHCGAYNFNAATSLSSQPSYSSRIPGGTDYTGLQLWYEQVTNATGTQNIAVTYTDQSGGTGHTTGTIAVPGTLGAGSCYQLPLAAGDCGIQKVESVTGTVASAGTFNIFVARPLWYHQPIESFTMYSRNFDQLGFPEVYPDSALHCLLYNTSVAHSLDIEIAFK